MSGPLGFINMNLYIFYLFISLVTNSWGLILITHEKQSRFYFHLPFLTQTRKDSSAKKKEKKVRTCLGCRRAQTLTFSIRRRHQTWFSALTKKRERERETHTIFYPTFLSVLPLVLSPSCPDHALSYRVFLFLIKLLDNWPWPAGERVREPQREIWPNFWQK